MPVVARVYRVSTSRLLASFTLIRLLDGFCCRLWLTVHSSDLCVRKQCNVIELYCLYDRFWGNPCYTHFLTVKFGKNAGCWYSSDLKVGKEDLRERKKPQAEFDRNIPRGHTFMSCAA